MASKSILEVSFRSCKIVLLQNDITKLAVDCIVNAANNSLLGGGGVDGAIHRAAGRDLLLECQKLQGCETGEAKITSGYKLPSKKVIHTVGPIGAKPDKLSSCYKSSLDLMKANDLRSIAFPCISTGVYGYPNLEAAIVALKTVKSWLEDEKNAESVDSITFCVFLDKDTEIFKTLIPKYFPSDSSVVNEEKEQSEKESDQKKS